MHIKIWHPILDDFSKCLTIVLGTTQSFLKNAFFYDVWPKVN